MMDGLSTVTTSTCSNSFTPRDSLKGMTKGDMGPSVDELVSSLSVESSLSKSDSFSLLGGDGIEAIVV